MCNSLANGGPGSTEQLPLSSGALEPSAYLCERNNHHLMIFSQLQALPSLLATNIPAFILFHSHNPKAGGRGGLGEQS